ncbi:MAG TPA: helix-turn-helix transcriptional regulator [Longimicrobiaceae bacterium]|nr:helix-turn-helix transcriptional regulator [Longimicrobiaceae bacterium]
MSTRLNLTYPTALVLRALAEGFVYGFDVMDASGLPSGTVYPALRRLERAGCVASHWEEENAARREGRPARRYYEVTDEGRSLLARAHARFAGLDHGLHTGVTAGDRE